MRCKEIIIGILLLKLVTIVLLIFLPPLLSLSPSVSPFDIIKGKIIAKFNVENILYIFYIKINKNMINIILITRYVTEMKFTKTQKN